MTNDDSGYLEVSLDILDDKRILETAKMAEREVKKAKIQAISVEQEKAKEAKLKAEKDFEKIEIDAVCKINKHYALMDDGSILHEMEGGGFKFISFAALKNAYANDPYYHPRDINLKKPLNKAGLWLKHPERRSYLNGITFDVKNPGHKEGDYYNLWQGFAVEKPIKSDKSELFWKHVLECICANDLGKYRFIRRYLAHAVQKTEELPGIALVLVSGQGTGKNSFVEAFGYLFGAHAIEVVSIDTLTSRFNASLQHSIIVHLNEAVWGGDKRCIGLLKSMVTERKGAVEMKGKERFVVPNYKRLIISSNENHPIHMDFDDRRHLVLEVDPAWVGRSDLWDDYHKALKNGGYEAILWDLLNEDITDFRPSKMPASSDRKIEIQLQSMQQTNPVASFFYQVLKEETWELQTTTASAWQCRMLLNRMYNLFCNWNASNSKQTIVPDVFSKRMYAMFPNSFIRERPWNHAVGKRENWVNVVSIAAARADFQKTFGLSDRIWND